MKLFFDTEFTGLYKDCRLISIGFISENGKRFYAEVDDNFDDVDDWIKQFDSIEFVSDVCHFDFVLLTDIFGTVFDLPKKCCPCMLRH